MEDALRWGVEHIFSRQNYTTEPAQDTDTATAGPPRPSSAAAAASPRSHGDTKMEDAPSPRSPSQPAQQVGMAAGSTAAESTPSPQGQEPSASPEPSMKSPFGSPELQQQPKSHGKAPVTNSSSVFQPVYTDRVVEKVLEWSAVQSRQAKAKGHSRGEGENKVVGDSGDGERAPSLGQVLGPGWSCVKLHEWQQGQLDDDAQADEGEILCTQTVFHIFLMCRCELLCYGMATVS